MRRVDVIQGNNDNFPLFLLDVFAIALYKSVPGGGGHFLIRGLMGMCRWMGSHFHNWIDYHGVTFSIVLLEWGRTFSHFWDKTVLDIYS